MEVTLHTPLSEWYVPTAANDLTYWGQGRRRWGV